MSQNLTQKSATHTENTSEKQKEQRNEHEKAFLFSGRTARMFRIAAVRKHVLWEKTVTESDQVNGILLLCGSRINKEQQVNILYTTGTVVHSVRSQDLNKNLRKNIYDSSPWCNLRFCEIASHPTVLIFFSGNIPQAQYTILHRQAYFKIKKEANTW